MVPTYNAMKATDNDGPRLLEDARAAVGEHDAGRAQRAAHKLKGALGYLNAGPAAAAAQRLEALGEGGTLGGADGMLRDLEAEMDRLMESLAESVPELAEAGEPGA